LSLQAGCRTLAARALAKDHAAMPRAIEDRVGAFVPGVRMELPGAPEGPLAGLGFGLKDLFDVAGAVTGYGHPDWARTHPPAAATAPAVMALLGAGASLRGKTKTVELAYGLTGENVWHGTPTNPAAPDRFPGGSSCGSAAATAAELVDFAIGSDTGGSVRIPASYCGIFGIRPTWGAISLAGARALGPSFDTLGWFARSARLLREVGGVLLPPGGEAPLGPALKVQEAWINAVPATAAALSTAMEAVERVTGPAMALNLVPEGLHQLYENFRGLGHPRRLDRGNQAAIRPGRRRALRRRQGHRPGQGGFRARLPRRVPPAPARGALGRRGAGVPDLADGRAATRHAGRDAAGGARADHGRHRDRGPRRPLRGDHPGRPGGRRPGRAFAGRRARP
jgi:hypothetical protein